jgi:acyl-coenzyme A thioesterase PaaI-like protein
VNERSEQVMQAIQDSIPHNHCWGCGTLNPRGLQIKSYPEDDGTVCRFVPSPDHMAGPTHVVNGGIIAAVVDCHSICTAIADAYRAAGRELGSEPLIWCVTASLKIDYLAPTPISAPMELRARVREAKGRKRVVECTVTSGGRECARAEVVAVEVPAAWTQPGGPSGRREPG